MIIMKENYKKHKIKGLLIIWHSELNKNT